MDEREAGLSERSATILGLIAEGRSYDQILQQQPDVTYFDVFAAAREALDLLQRPATGQPSTTMPDIEVPVLRQGTATSQPPTDMADIEMLDPVQTTIPPQPPAVAEVEVLSAVSQPSFIERARATHGRAWARWSRDEDARLTALFRQGASRAELVRQLGRQPGAVERRLVKLGLITEEASAAPGVGREARAGSSAGREERAGPSVGHEERAGLRVEHEVHAGVPGAVEVPAHEVRVTEPSVVPGWETLRDRLTPRREIT